ncbi:cysteine desulfurase NifS [Clostridium akagii]|uniref:cysteine desulfurase NifS n=1 Tax=Clostridium akagii TaxID=91623 RepID=UPI00047E5EF2|nr:cysteine desulfurase NifS [Clostridium akagii]
MNNKIIYMDYGATTPVDKDVFKEMEPYFCSFYGNPSSVSAFSLEPKMAIDKARSRVAKAINCKREEIFFTSGGTESDNWAIKGTAFAKRKSGNHIITSEIEHPAVLNTCRYLETQGFDVTYVPVKKNGMVDLDYLEKSINSKTILISIMLANNEVGTLEPIEEIGKICTEKNIAFHTDAVQAIGHINVDVQKLKVDMLSMSAHKFYGPKGIGVLYIKKGMKVDNYFHGGEQERARRAGTENTPAIVGLGKAIEKSNSSISTETVRLKSLRDKFLKEVLEIHGTSINGDLVNRIPGNSNICFHGIEAETLLMALDLRGICASVGSACSAGSLEPSHVLIAMGLSEENSRSSMRFSFGSSTSEQEVENTVKALKEIIRNIQNV